MYRSSAPGVESLPVGILHLSIKEITASGIQKVEMVMQGPEIPSHVRGESSSCLANSVLNIVFAYYKAMPSKDTLLHNCVKLAGAMRAINVPIMLNPSSANRILEYLRFSNTSESRILPLGIILLAYSTFKHSHLLPCYLEYITKVLAQLEKVMRRRDKAMWPVCFAANAHIVLLIAEAGKHAENGKEPRHYYEALDNGPYAQLAHLFHALYRTGKVDTGGLSPFAQGFGSRDDVSGLEDAAINMVREIREKVLSSGWDTFG
ncbi:hypothetical protein LZ554_001166 [Drepanopeziza brunnea f. sp. 'monogermtubi']|nr:hypothetical protein LZ554_001166 [Drepanopeziza brunnea f. sp. 'monogermtubi']